jgi:hypothetical protein
VENPQLPIIDYSPRSEKLTLGEWWAKAPVRFTLLICIICNWFVWGIISLCIGGDAIGTMPSAQGYLLRSNGKFRAVSKGIWVFSLSYSTATLLITPLAFVLVCTALIRGMFGGRAPYWKAALVFSIFWYGPWAYAIIYHSFRSLFDVWHLDSIWPTFSWVLMGGAIAALLVLIIGAKRESKRRAMRAIGSNP